MHLGEWRPRVKRQLRPHQPELSDSAELRIEPPAFTGTRGHSSKRNVRRRRGTAAARGFAHVGDIAMGVTSDRVPKRSAAARSQWPHSQGFPVDPILKNDENSRRVSKLGTCQKSLIF